MWWYFLMTMGHLLFKAMGDENRVSILQQRDMCPPVSKLTSPELVNCRSFPKGKTWISKACCMLDGSFTPKNMVFKGNYPKKIHISALVPGHSEKNYHFDFQIHLCWHAETGLPLSAAPLLSLRAPGLMASWMGQIICILKQGHYIYTSTYIYIYIL